jgi:predicted metal-dependent phosphoesterase TrpH
MFSACLRAGNRLFSQRVVFGGNTEDVEDGLLLCELHSHTTWSDGFLTTRALVDLYGGLGFDVLCITDHVLRSDEGGRGVAEFAAYFDELEQESARAWTLYGLLVIPGLELTYNDADPDRAGHALALGLREPAALDPGLVRAMTAARDAGAAIVAAHPNGLDRHPASRGTRFFYRHWAQLEGLVDRFELFNRRQVFPWVADAGLPVVATGDFHHLENLAGWKTLLPSEKDESAVLDYLKSPGRAYLLPWGRDLDVAAEAAA